TSPIDVLDAEDIRRAGAGNGELGSALQALLPSFNFPRQSNSGGADPVRAAQLRGLAPDQVLVLVNGKRRHTSALVSTGSKIGRGTTPVDFNAIPVSAIRRIEVLRDGAGAQYGSDAVAGVINIILDDRAEGGAIEASYGLHHTDLAPIGRTLTDGQTAQLSAKVGTALGEDGFLRLGVEFKERSGTNRAGFDQVPPWDQTPANLAVQGQRNYPMADGDSRTTNAWFNAEPPLAEPAASAAFAQSRPGTRPRPTRPGRGRATTTWAMATRATSTPGSTPRRRWARPPRSTPSARTTSATPRARTTSATPTAAPTGPRSIPTA